MSSRYPFWKDQERAIIESSYQSQVAELKRKIERLEGRECPECKRHIQVDAEFCAYCGRKL